MKFGQMVLNFLENIKKAKRREKDCSFGEMAQNIKEISIITTLMEREFMNGTFTIFIELLI